MIFKYNETQLNVGFYIVEVSHPNSKATRLIAEWSNDSWLQTGSDYDYWQYSAGVIYIINVIAKIDIHNLTITEVEPLGKYEDI